MQHRNRIFGRALGVAAMAATAAVTVIASASSASAAPYTTGDVFASVGNGQVNEYSPTGALQQTLDDTNGGFTTGSAFDAAGNFYVTNFNAGTVSKFDAAGALVSAAWASGFTSPESIIVDNAGNFYVGDASQAIITKLDPSGAVLTTYPVTTEDRGTDWIDLQADQCTIRYTSEGQTVFQYNVCTSTQLAPLTTTLPGSAAYALRNLSDGGALVADSEFAVRLDSSGAVIQTYTPTTVGGGVFALNLDPNGTSFWTGDYANGQVSEFDIASAAQQQDWSTGSAALFGLSVKGEISCGGACGGGSNTTVTCTHYPAIGSQPDYNKCVVNDPDGVHRLKVVDAKTHLVEQKTGIACKPTKVTHANVRIDNDGNSHYLIVTDCADPKAYTRFKVSPAGVVT
ncbi:MAG: hypothetical protein ACJ735_11570 [Actinomycetes bacterium]